jgi:hypothetical protein
MIKTKEKGITLIALIITIIIMLILASVTIAIIMNGGLFTQARTAAEETRGASVAEEVEIWRVEKRMGKYSGIGAQTREQLINSLADRKLLTPEEKAWLLADPDNHNIIEIPKESGREIDFTEEPVIKVKEINIIEELTIYIGTTHEIGATILPDEAENKEVKWTSSNSGIVEVQNQAGNKATLKANAIRNSRNNSRGRRWKQR